MGWTKTGTLPAGVVTDAGVENQINNGTLTKAAVAAKIVLPAIGDYTYANGAVTVGPNGELYAYNLDGTVATVTFEGVTRTLEYNTDGTIKAVS